MNKIEFVPRLNAIKNRVLLNHIDGVPAHMRNFQTGFFQTEFFNKKKNEAKGVEKIEEPEESKEFAG